MTICKRCEERKTTHKIIIKEADEYETTYSLCCPCTHTIRNVIRGSGTKAKRTKVE